MRISLKQSVFLICLICVIIGIYCWDWWQKYKLIRKSDTHPTPKPNVHELEQAIQMDNRLTSQCQHFSQGKQAFVVDSKGYICERRHLEKATGCCDIKRSSTHGPSICDNCSLTTHCCALFEHCISCCLKPAHVLDELEPLLVSRIRQQFNDRQRRQMLIELLGSEFQWKLLRFEPDIPYILTPPYMLEEDRRKLENEAKSWLQIQTFKAAFEIGAAIMEDQDSHHLSKDMKKFLEYTYDVVSKSFERYLYQIQHKEVLKQEEKRIQENLQNESISRSKFRSILKDSQSNAKKVFLINESVATPCCMTSQYSNIISKAIVALLKYDSRRVIFIKEKLFGQQLSITLRHFIWTECLLRIDNEPFEHDLSFVEFQTRRDFAAGVTRGKNELKLKNVFNTPVTNIIENEVIETYSKIHALYPYLEEHHLRLTIKILNVLYAYKKQYEPQYIYWLLPFQLSYVDDGNQDEEIYVLAMHLNLFIRHCFPKWSQIFAIANEIILDLSMNDREFYDHLQSIANTRKNISPKDFIKPIILLENKETDNILPTTDNITSDSTIFLRKWISEMFVGILSSNATLYLWDQFFMMSWNTLCIKQATKVILYLLRNNFMYATDYTEMRRIFLNEPCQLYTSDIQAAFIHLAIKNNDPRYIPNMNQHFYSKGSLNSTRYISNRQKVYAAKMGIKTITLSLIMPPHQDIERDLKYSSLIVEIQIHCNGEVFGIVTTKSVPVIAQQERLKNDWLKVVLDIPNDKLILSIQQIRQSAMPTLIQALVLVRQRLNVTNLNTLGYCRFPLYIPQKVGNLDTWEVTYGPVKRALHIGKPPASIDTIPDLPRTQVTDIIGPGSSISLFVFDPKLEQDL